jgi:hypothetical protein
VSAPVLAGDLRVIPLPDILLLLNTNHKTGTLRCMRAGATKTVDWEKGEIVFARSTMPGDRLGAFLLAQGTITPAQLQEASALVGGPDRLGKVLIRIGAMTPSRLWSAVQIQVTEIVYSLFHWQEGLFEFRETPPATEKIVLDISVMNLIMEGTRRLDEWSRVKQKIQNDRVILAPVKSADELARQVKLSDFERIALGLVDGRRAVREIIALAARPEFETWQALHALLSAGVIRVQLFSFDPAEAAADDGARAIATDDADLEKAIDRYGGAVSLLLARAAAASPAETARLRRRLREATFERAELLKEIAIEPDGRIDRRVLLANVADLPPGERSRALQGALERLLRLLMDELKGKVSLDDVASALDPAE